MKLISLCPLLVTLLGVLHPMLTQAQDSSGSGQSQPTDPIVGRWRWFSNEFVYIKTDGTLTKGGGVLGRWRCVNAAEWPRKYVLDWGNGMWVDTLSLRKDCSILSGKNQQHGWVHATRSDRNGSGGMSATESAAIDGPAPLPLPLVNAAERNEIRMQRLDQRASHARASYQATLSSPSSLPPHQLGSRTLRPDLQHRRR